MPKELSTIENDRLGCAGSGGGFPYIARCETLRDVNIDLATLRANAAKLRAKARAFGNKRFKMEVIASRRAPLRRAVGNLSLPQDAADRLLIDMTLIAAWHLQPARQVYMQTDVEGDRRSLKATARALRKITLIDQLAAENLIEVLPASHEGQHENLNLDELFRQVDLFCSAAKQVERRLRGQAGRQVEARRDRTLQLVASALDEVARPLTLSRGTTARPGYHFTSASGSLLLTFMHRLGWPDEAVLARAFERHRVKTR